MPVAPPSPHPPTQAREPLGVYALVGLVQGLALYGLHHAFDNKHWPWPSGPLLVAFGYAAVTGPVAWYLAHDAIAGARARAVFAAIFALAMALLGAHAGASLNLQTRHESDGPMVGHVLGAAIAGFIVLALAGGVDVARRRYDYPKLFELAWRNALLLPLAAFSTGVLWLLLVAGAWLMESIGLAQMMVLLKEPACIALISATAFGLAVGAALTRAHALKGLQRLVLALTTWFLPLALLLALAWLVALAFTGVQPLFATRNAAFYLYWFCALTVWFANAAHHDGREPPPYPFLLARATGVAWLAMPVLALLGDWALYQRVAQHGWSDDRIWAAVVGAGVTAHAFGYAASSARRGPWMRTLPATNVALSAALALLLVLLVSPLADVRGIAVRSQLARLERGAIQPNEFDFDFLLRTGPYGREALKRLAALPPTGARERELATRATQTLTDRDSGTSTLDPERFAQALKSGTLPAGRTPDPALITLLVHDAAEWDQRNCRPGSNDCLLWLTDLDRDGRDEAVLVWGRKGVWAELYALDAEGWRKQGSVVGGPSTLQGWRMAIEAGHVQTTPSRWPDVRLGDRELRVNRRP